MWKKKSRPNFSQYVSNCLEEPVDQHEQFWLLKIVSDSRLNNRMIY